MRPDDARVFADPDPVPAIAELVADAVTDLPTTTLV